MPSATRRVTITLVLNEDADEYIDDAIVRKMLEQNLDFKEDVAFIESVEFPDGIKGELSDSDFGGDRERYQHQLSVSGDANEQPPLDPADSEHPSLRSGDT